MEGMTVDTVFDVFDLSDYTFLKISRGGVYGNVIEESYPAEGVFKLRSGMVQANNQESRQSDSTLHVKPDESFIADITVDGKILFVGHGIRVQGKEYEITGATGGQNYETNELEHYRLTLQSADFSEFVEES